jgi:hypothetical protein
MKKVSASIMIMVLLLSFCGCSQKEEDLPTFIITENNHEFLEDGIITATDNYTYTYNEAGLTIYSEHYQNGSLLSTTSWEYDEFENPIKITTEGNDTVEIFEYKYTLDKDGRILSQEMYQNGKLISVDTFTYDGKGNELTHEYKMFSENDEISDWRTYTKTYNRKDMLTKETLHWNFNDKYIIWDYEDELCVRQTTYENETDKIVEYWIYTYDEKGNQTQKSRYDEADNLLYYNESTWDDTGLVQTERIYNADGTPRNHFDVFTYDEYGNEIMQERYRDEEVYWRISYVYEQLEVR